MALAGRCSKLAGSVVCALRPSQACRSLTTQTLPDLPYDYSALEPVISAEIMKLHHSKHHNTYITTLNQSYEKYADAEAKNDVAKMIELQQAIKFNGGGINMFRRCIFPGGKVRWKLSLACLLAGHVNHSIFWQNLTPPKVSVAIQDYEHYRGICLRTQEVCVCMAGL